MATRRERRPAELKCQDCGYEFVERVPQVSHGVEESSVRTSWMVERVDLNCPSCGSWRVGERNA